MKIEDWLTRPSEEMVRTKLLNLCDSYNHPYDILAELCQNSVDAIRDWEIRYPGKKRDHKISITVDAKLRNIIVTDTGTGIDPDKLEELLAPDATDKRNKEGQIGEKGVGLTYCIFQSNRFTIRSSHEKGMKEVVTEGCASWLSNTNPKMPSLEVMHHEQKPIPCEETGTSVVIESVLNAYEPSIDIFNQNSNTIKSVLQTKTAIGYTDKELKNKTFDIKTTLLHKPLDGEERIVEVDFNYAWPHLIVEDSNIVDYDEYMKKAALMNDEQKIKMLKGKCISRKREFSRHGSSIQTYSFFVTSRVTWDKITTGLGISESDEESESHYYRVPVGITVATRGMPTGISVEHPRTGGAGYWENILILMEHDKLSFDLGRKSIPGRTQGMLKEIAKELFNDMIRLYLMASNLEDGGSGTGRTPSLKPSAAAKASRATEFEKVKKLSSLGLDEINFQKYPDGQEAAVAAIFFELIGAKLLKGYQGLKTSYGGQYDCWAEYRINKSHLGEDIQRDSGIEEEIALDVVIEFKHKCSSIIKDVEYNRKAFDELDLVVCWDIDESEFTKNNIDVHVIPKSKVYYHGSNYELEWPGAYNLGASSKKQVIALRKFIEDYVQSK